MNKLDGRKRMALEAFESIARDGARRHNELKIGQLEAVLCGLLDMNKADNPPSVTLLEGKPIVPLRGGDPAQIALIAKIFGLVPNKN